MTKANQGDTIKRKIIITFDDDDMGAESALFRMAQIAAGGYKSVEAGVPHYSWVTLWEFPGHNILALAKIKKNAAAADSIKFIKEVKEAKANCRHPQADADLPPVLLSEG